MKAKNWKAIYKNRKHPDVANTLHEAKERGKRYYRNKCRRHGPTIFATLDNTCPYCVRAAQKERRKNKVFNRPREVRGEVKRRARERGIVFSLSTTFIRGHTGTICPIFNIPYEYGTHEYKDMSPSIDRIDNDKGYTEDNVAIISTRANRIKSDGTTKEHLLVVRWMLKQQGKTKLARAVEKIIERM